MTNDLQHHFCSCQQDLLQRVLTEQPAEATVFISPTLIAAKAACRRFQPQWRWSATLWLSMDEFKERCFPESVPLLQEEKRTLAFYTSLSPEARQKFQIQNYFQSIELAQNFFAFWEECNEMLLADPLDFTALPTIGVELQEWQQDFYQHLVSIKEIYGHFIQANAYQDRLFTHKPERIDLREFAPYQRLVFINQYALTPLEKEILTRWCDSGKDVICYHQGEPAWLETERSEIKAFSFQDVSSKAIKSATLYECRNDFSMMAALSQLLHQSANLTIVDHQASFNPYYRFLSWQKIGLRLYQPFPHCTIYRFLTRLYALMSGLTPDQHDSRRRLLPLQILLEALTDQDFYAYFCPLSVESASLFCERGLAALYRLIEQDYKYIDLEGEFFSLSDPNVHLAQEYLQPVLTLLQRIAPLRRLQELTALIDANDGIRIRDLINDLERAYSDILDVFYQSLADFSTLESLEFLDDWQNVFNPEHGSITAVMSRGWFRLLLDYLKPKRILFSTAPTSSPRVEVMRLQDTCNLTFDRVALINLHEGVLPSAPRTPFLFNEHQRERLGLNTYKRIRLAEKVDFARLIFTTAEVHLFAQKNIDNNVEISSFVEELALYLPSATLNRVTISDSGYRPVYRQLLPAPAFTPAISGMALTPDFFTLPIDADSEFPDRTITLSFYQYQTLSEHPFLFYIKHLLHIEPRPRQVEYDFTLPFTGKLAHEILNTLWHLYLKEATVPSPLTSWSQLASAYLERAYQQWLQRRENRFKIPQNHSKIYFTEVFWPILRSGIESFFLFLDDVLHLPMNRMRIFPESEFTNAADQEAKTLLTWNETNGEWKVNIKGRADLRLESTPQEEKIIFDYKTGEIKVEQLLFYELFYYLIVHPEWAERVCSYGYNLIKNETYDLMRHYRRSNRSISKTQLSKAFCDQLQAQLSQILANGFSLGSARVRQEDWQEVMRTDLYQKFKP